MPMMLDKREYRKIDISEMEVRKGENGEMVVEGYATTFNMPYRLMDDKEITVNEQVDRGAFEECDTSDTIMQYDHDGPVFARVSNGTLQLKADDHGLLVTAFLGGTERGRQLYEEIAGGYVTKMSIGFKVAGEKRTRSRDADGHVTVLRTITKFLKLFDVSAVSQPANDATEISARNVGDGLIAEVLKEVQAEEARKAQIEEIRRILKGDTEHHDE